LVGLHPVNIIWQVIDPPQRTKAIEGRTLMLICGCHTTM
jgi:hypothetical protein